MRTRILSGVVTAGMLVMACGTDTPVSPVSAFRESSAPQSGWRLVAPKGSGPSESSAYAAAPEQRALFAAKMPDYQPGTLWRFDLVTDTWSRLRADNWPIGKYRKLVYDPRKRRLLTYWDGLGQVYAIPETGGSWTPVGSAGNSDEYYEAYAFLNPVTNRLAVFAGYGSGSWKNLLWEWAAEANLWRNVEQGANRPEPRFGNGSSAVAVDASRRRAFLGQRSLGAAAGNYDDLWVIDLTTRRWTNLIPPGTGSGARIGSALVYAPTTRTLYRFGGTSLYGFAPVNDFLSLRPDGDAVAWVRMPASDSEPSPRSMAGLFYDAPRQRLVLVSGNDGVTGWADDVWTYRVR